MFRPDRHRTGRPLGLLRRQGGRQPDQPRPAFDRLAEDWLAVFRLGLPGFDGYPHLVLLGALHVALYQLEHMRAEPHAVVDRAVAAAGEAVRPQAKGLVNALLRRYLREREA